MNLRNPDPCRRDLARVVATLVVLFASFLAVPLAAETDLAARAAATRPERMLLVAVAGDESARPTEQPRIRRRATIQLDPAVLSGERAASPARFVIEPFVGTTFELELTRTERRDVRATWHGRTLGLEPGDALLSERDGRVQLNLWLDDGRRFEVRSDPLGDGISIEFEPSAFAPCGNDDHRAIQNAPADSETGTRAASPPGCVDDGSIVDVLVAYTSNARAAQGGTSAMLTLIDQAEAATNQAYAVSQIPLTLNIVHTVEVAYTSSGNAATDLARLRNPFDGILDQLHPLRDEKRADIVSLIVNDFELCGLAYLGVGPGNQAVPGNAFNVIERDCTVAQHVFAHEAAHNQGSLHDRANPGANAGAFPYSYGYVGPSFRTIMGTGGPSINQFSNPDVLYDGQPTGVPTSNLSDSAHNALSLTSTALTVARFRCSLFDCNNNGVEDLDDITAMTSDDCDNNDVPDECEEDCNGNAILDSCDIASGTSDDCNTDGAPDECELPSEDCNANGLVDECDVTSGGSTDCGGNGIPDECEVDCNANGVEDSCDLAGGTSFDCQNNGVPDECDTANGVSDADGDDVPDQCQDCDGSGVLDSSEIAVGQLTDANADGIADECDRVRNITRGTQHATLQFALDGSFDGDTIEAAPGVYNELIDFLGKKVALRSTDGPESTTIDGAGLGGSVVTLGQLEDSRTVLDGFLVTGGFGTPTQSGDTAGGGIFASNALDAVIVNCIIDRNRADLGAGLFVSGGAGALQLHNLVFTANSARRGGAIYIESAFDTVDVAHATIVGNVAPLGGGAIHASSLGSASVTSSIIHDNGPGAIVGGIDFEFSNVEGAAGGTTIDADPRFLDAAEGNFRLKASSPCVDSGDTVSLTPDIGDADRDGDLLEPLPLDLDWSSRVTGQPAPPQVDMGAYERPPPVAPTPIADGTNGGQPLRASRLDADGSSLEIVWDDGCPQDFVTLLYGDLGQVSGLTVAGALCGDEPPLAWSAVPPGDLWFIVVGRNAYGVEGSWGLATAGERGTGSSGECESPTQDLSGSCP